MSLKTLKAKMKSVFTFRPYRRLFFSGDNGNWVLDWETREIKLIAEKLGIACRKELANLVGIL